MEAKYREKTLDKEALMMDCQKVIMEYLDKFGSGKRRDFEKILLEKLPDVLSRELKRPHSPDLLNGTTSNEVFWLSKENGFTKAKRFSQSQ